VECEVGRAVKLSGFPSPSRPARVVTSCFAASRSAEMQAWDCPAGCSGRMATGRSGAAWSSAAGTGVPSGRPSCASRRKAWSGGRVAHGRRSRGGCAPLRRPRAPGESRPRAGQSNARDMSKKVDTTHGMVGEGEGNDQQKRIRTRAHTNASSP